MRATLKVNLNRSLSNLNHLISCQKELLLCPTKKALLRKLKSNRLTTI